MSNDSRVVVAMLGARMHYAVPRILHEEGMLERFFTDFYVGNKPWLKSILGSLPVGLTPGVLRRSMGRSDAVIPSERVESFDGLGVWYAWALARAKSTRQREATYVEAAMKFAQRICRSGLGEASVLFGFNTAAKELFEEGKARGLYCVLEQSSLPKRLDDGLMRQAAARWPDLEPGLDIGDGESALPDREAREWELADLIIAGSTFVASGLAACGVQESKIKVVPYGVSDRQFPVANPGPSSGTGGPLHVLFVGRVGIRKGIPELLQAIEHLDSGGIDVRVAGGIDLSLDRLKIPPNVRFLGQVSRADVSTLYSWADILVMPSVSEGSATVTYEALMSGVPVVATANAGSIVRDGEDGILIPIHDPDALARAIEGYAADRAILAGHRECAIRDRTRVSLDRYRADLGQLFRGIESNRQFSQAVRQ